MTLMEKYEALMADLVKERAEFPGWESYYDKKIEELRLAMPVKPLWAPGSPKGEVTTDET